MSVKPVATEVYPDLAQAKKLMEAREYDAAWEIIDKRLQEDPNCVPALIQASIIYDKANKVTLAYQMGARLVELAPKYADAWNNFGRYAERLYRLPEAESAYQTAIMLINKNIENKPELAERLRPTMAAYVNNLASCYATMGDFERCEEVAGKCLEIEPEHQKAKANMGLAQLAQRKWGPGWVNYAHSLGTDIRRLVKYRNEPEWDGTPGATVVVTGEQGLGDEVSFASMLPDAIRCSRKVIVDCDARLETLFQRSFPEAKIYGTRWKNEGLQWATEDQFPDYSISIGQLGRIFRQRDEDFPGTPYLKADPERVTMWRQFFATKRKPIIGIAWTGGLAWTAERFRRWKLEELNPLFNAVDAHWVSLQYKDASAEIREFGGGIHQYDWATLTKNYDDTAGLVAACDLVICMQTSVGHLAAALGVETWCFVNKLCQWRYGTDTMLWYKAMQLYRQRLDGSWPIEEAARVLRLRYGGTELKRA